MIEKQLEKQLGRHTIKRFKKSEKSSFPYWYYHWKAFNLTAYYLHRWKFKYLFHDIEKPWLKLFLPYSKVQAFHRRNSSHHFEYKKGVSNIDYVAMIIDNECSRYTKIDSPMTAREYIEFRTKDESLSRETVLRCFDALEELGL